MSQKLTFKFAYALFALMPLLSFARGGEGGERSGERGMSPNRSEESRQSDLSPHQKNQMENAYHPNAHQDERQYQGSEVQGYRRGYNAGEEAGVGTGGAYIAPEPTDDSLYPPPGQSINVNITPNGQ